MSEIVKVEALRAEAEQIEERYADADEVPDEITERLEDIEVELEAIHQRPALYDPADIARAGVFVSIDSSGRLRVERGYVRAEGDIFEEEPESDHAESDRGGDGDGNDDSGDTGSSGGTQENDSDRHEPPEEDDTMRPLSDKLLTELTAFRTLALREAVGNDPAIAYLAVLHVLCVKLFYRYGFDSCLEIEPKNVVFGTQAPGLADTPLAERVNARHRNWAEQLPEEPGALWDALATFDSDSRDALFAHCVSLTVNAVHDAYNRRPKAIAHADRVAEAVSLDMVVAGWRPTADNYLGRVPKARIVQAVREAKGEHAAERIANLKKAEMVTEAERLLDGTGWLPEPLRTVAIWLPVTATVDETAAEPEPLAGTDNGLAGVHQIIPEPPHPDAMAAE